MNTTKLFLSASAAWLVAVLPQQACARAPHQAWTDPALAMEEDPDFSIQGEYATEGAGVQVAALGGGDFRAFVYEGGLPGAGWSPGMGRELLEGGREEDDVVVLAAEDGKTTATIRNGRLKLNGADGGEKNLNRVLRESPTLGAEPPDGAVVLFDGSSADAWEGGKMEDGLLMATSTLSKRHFTDYKLHLEFRNPYMPTARGQRRGNSGVYYGGRWETQILDSFGFGAGPGDCGGIYSIAPPKLNMCLPPLTWQTYNVEFTAAKFDADGNRTAWPRITVKLNGVLVHDDLELAKDFTPAAPITGALEGTEGPIYLQDHNDPVVFRNIWLVESGE